MKKLFLYLNIFYIAVFIFFVAYIISKEKFNQSSKDIIANTVEITTTEESVDVLDYIENQNKTENVSTDTDPDITCYRVEIKNGYVVVLYDDGSVFDYTGIDAKVIKNTDFDLYSKIKDGIIFYEIKELYDFLESIAS